MRRETRLKRLGVIYLFPYMREKGRKTGGEEDRDGAGLSNMLLTKVKDMFYS